MDPNNPYGQYPQQQYQQSQQEEIYIPPSKKPNYAAAFLIIIILVAAIILYFLMKPKMGVEDNKEAIPTEDFTEDEVSNTNEETENKTSQSSNLTQKYLNFQATGNLNISVSKIKVCSGYGSIVCDENVWRSFKKGDSFYAYLEINSKIYGEDYLEIQEGIKILDANNKVVYENPEYKYERIDTYDNETNIIPLVVELPREAKTLTGKHTLELTIKDLNINQDTLKTISYQIIS